MVTPVMVMARAARNRSSTDPVNDDTLFEFLSCFTFIVPPAEEWFIEQTAARMDSVTRVVGQTCPTLRREHSWFVSRLVPRFAPQFAPG
jgi:hypothetical protein